ncbi:MAG: VTT domain-containing protein [Bowdeniella nasicola]|nr:VTT domain-containing protein [Bowdeniella nasicola]
MIENFYLLQETILGLVDTPWILVAIFVMTVIDGFFPPIPSESVVIAAAVLIVSGQGPSLIFLIVAAAAGAFVGDIVAFGLGRILPIDRIRLLNTAKAVQARHWAEEALRQRATVFIMSARFIPVGRVAVNMTAGAVGYPLVFFVIIDVIASIFWACYSVVLGLVFGQILKETPLLGVLIGVAGGVLIGFIVDFILKRIYGRILQAKVAKFQPEDN